MICSRLYDTREKKEKKEEKKKSLFFEF